MGFVQLAERHRADKAEAARRDAERRAAEARKNRIRPRNPWKSHRGKAANRECRYSNEHARWPAPVPGRDAHRPGRDSGVGAMARCQRFANPGQQYTGLLQTAPQCGELCEAICVLRTLREWSRSPSCDAQCTRTTIGLAHARTMRVAMLPRAHPPAVDQHWVVYDAMVVTAHTISTSTNGWQLPHK